VGQQYTCISTGRWKTSRRGDHGPKTNCENQNPATEGKASSKPVNEVITDPEVITDLNPTSGNSVRDEVLVIIRREVNAEVVPLSFAECERLAQEILAELFRGNLQDGDIWRTPSNLLERD